MNLITFHTAPLAFETEHLLIRRGRLSDANDLFEAARESIDEVYPFLPWCHPGYEIDDSRKWLKSIEPAWNQGNTWSFMIRDKKNKRLLGGCGLNRIDEHPVANLGYWVRTTAVGHGIATEASLGLAAYAFTYLDMARLEIIMSTRNVASRRVAEKCRARYEGLMKNRLRLQDEFHDAYLYALTTDNMPKESQRRLT